jgi:hypothetical protein
MIAMGRDHERRVLKEMLDLRTQVYAEAQQLYTKWKRGFSGPALATVLSIWAVTWRCGDAISDNELLDFATPLFSSAMRTFDLGKGIAAHDLKLVEGSPVSAILCTETDTPPAWLASGQALARVLLQACSHGAAASFLNRD